MRKILLLVGFAVAVAIPIQAQTQPPASPSVQKAGPSGGGSSDTSAAKARALLNQMVEALGGQRWLTLRNSYSEGSIAAFYQGKPTGADVRYWDWRAPTEERTDLSEKKADKHNWIQIVGGGQCWEITFRGKKPLTKELCADALRRRDHSIEAAVQVWMKEPSTILMYEGQSLAERHLADQVTLLNDQDDSITIQMDADTHLPLRRTYEWRDPVYHDKNEEVEEYDDYHTIEGLPTPFTITRFHNGDMTSQRFVFRAAYNVPLPEDGFDADALAAKAQR